MLPLDDGTGICEGRLASGDIIEGEAPPGGTFTLTVEPHGFPDTVLGRIALQCVIDQPNEMDAITVEFDYEFFDDGRSVLIEGDEAARCLIASDDIDIPEWVLEVQFVGVLTFGDWSVILDLEDGDLVVMESDVAPD